MIIMPATTIAMKENKSLGLTAFESIIIEGRDSAVTLIIKESIVRIAEALQCTVDHILGRE